jgi:hypothetical protein
MTNTVVYVDDISLPQLNVLPLLARTTNPNTMEYRNMGRVAGIVLVINVTAVVSTPSLTVALLGVDLDTGVTWNIITSAAITSTGVTVLKARPGITPAANVAVADIVPSVIRIVASNSVPADAITYSVTADLDRS